MAATNEQVQEWVNQRMRVRCEQLRALFVLMEDDKATIDDIYANVSDGGSTFADNHPANPPHLVTKQDILGYNTFITMILKLKTGGLTTAEAADANAQWPIIIDSCVRSLNLVVPAG